MIICKSAIKKWLIVPVMVVVWMLSLLYGSGMGQKYEVYGKFKWFIIFLILYHVIFTGRFKKVKKRIFFLMMYLLLSSIFTYFAYGNDMFDYLWLYLMIVLISVLPIEDEPVRLVSIFYGILSLAVLYIYNYGETFKGWNRNSIAIVAFFSFTVMIVSFNNTRKLENILFLTIYFVLYYQWSKILNSRSGLLFTIIMVLVVWEVLPFRQWFKKPMIITALLLVPLMIAVCIVAIRNSGGVILLESWSYATFNKPIFNGRDKLWYQGLIQWLNNPIIGNGNLSAANWHNSAITVLVGGGIVGFFIWIFGTRYLLEKATEYLDDQIIFGLITGFLIIWLQQSVELGLVAGQANAIPYAMLGLLIGRVRTLKNRD